MTALREMSPISTNIIQYRASHKIFRAETYLRGLGPPKLLVGPVPLAFREPGGMACTVTSLEPRTSRMFQSGFQQARGPNAASLM